MKERVELFQEQFPQKSIAQTALRNLYIKHGVRRKMVHLEKQRTPFQIEHYDEQRDLIVQRLEEAWDKD